MKKLLLITFAIFVLGIGNAQATDYLIESGYFGDLIIGNYDTLLMTGGWGDNLSIIDYAVATIENTDLPIGITNLSLSGYGSVYIYGGGIDYVEADSFASMNMTGGSLNSAALTGYSNIFTISGGHFGNLTITNDDCWFHITCYDLIYDGTYLNGKWADYTVFQIELIDQGISTYGQVIYHEIPEPATLLIFAVGGVFLAKRRKI